MRNHYHLPAQLGSFAVLKYTKARSLALEEKKKLLDKEGAVAILRQGRYRDWETDRKSTRLNSSH